MATPTYSINAGTQLHGIDADWQRQPIRTNDDGTLTYNDWARHIWRTQIMPVAEYIELQEALRNGLSSIETNDIDSRNSNKTYTNVIMENVSGEQDGRNIIGISVEFRVKTQ